MQQLCRRRGQNGRGARRIEKEKNGIYWPTARAPAWYGTWHGARKRTDAHAWRWRPYWLLTFVHSGHIMHMHCNIHLFSCYIFISLSSTIRITIERCCDLRELCHLWKMYTVSCLFGLCYIVITSSKIHPSLSSATAFAFVLVFSYSH